MMKLSVFSVLSILAFGIGAGDQAVMAQITSPNAPFKSRLTIQNSGKNAAFAVHRSPLGKPCLNMEAASRAHVINPNVYDNVVSIKNQCSKRIRVQICYLDTESCIDVDVPGYQRKDAVLGVRPHMQYFRYSYKEKF